MRKNYNVYVVLCHILHGFVFLCVLYKALFSILIFKVIQQKKFKKLTFFCSIPGGMKYLQLNYHKLTLYLF
jgi:hypothetical protein